VRNRSLFHLVLVFVSVGLLLAVAIPLWKPLLLGAVLAAGLLPWHDRLSAWLHGRRGLVAALFVIGLILLILLPLGWVISVAVRETLAGVAFLREMLQTHGPEALLERLPGWLSGPIRSLLGSFSASTEEMSALAKARGPATAAAVGTAVGATAQILVQGIFLLIAFYFLLLDGRRLVRWLAKVSPSPDETLSIANHLARASRSVLSSLFLTALVQAAAATVGYLIAGVPHPVFFGLLTLIAALIPSIGTAIVALPVAGLMFVLGHPWAALFLALWALGVVGLIDNVVKPLLIKGGVQLDAAVLFFALIGGLALFGAVGLIVGPLAVALFVAVVTRPVPEVREAAERVTPAPEERAGSAPH
jgi:predicted PurR-regulated permease PerM